jgi:hypothetical protein
MVSMDIAADTSRLRLDLEREKNRYARTVRRVVNAAAYGALDDVRADMVRTFDRPTPFVKRGPYVVPARDGDQFGGTEARIDWREFGAGPVTARKVLRAQIEGGPRQLKRFERAMGLPSNRIAVPGKWAPLDAFGNIPGPFLVQVLSALRLFGESGFRANRREGARLRKNQSDFFMVRPGAEHRQLQPGVYRIAREVGGAPLLVIAFVRAGQYRARFAPARVAAESVQRNIGALWQQGLAGSLPFRRGR